jgi:hypothetical protein
MLLTLGAELHVDILPHVWARHAGVNFCNLGTGLSWLGPSCTSSSTHSMRNGTNRTTPVGAVEPGRARRHHGSLRGDHGGSVARAWQLAEGRTALTRFDRFPSQRTRSGTCLP